MVLREIENEALPSRGDVVNARRALQRNTVDGRVSFSCQDVQLSVQASSLTFQTLEYICPPGQELHTNFLLCGKLEVAKVHACTASAGKLNGNIYWSIMFHIV